MTPTAKLDSMREVPFHRLRAAPASWQQYQQPWRRGSDRPAAQWPDPRASFSTHGSEKTNIESGTGCKVRKFGVNFFARRSSAPLSPAPVFSPHRRPGFFFTMQSYASFSPLAGRYGPRTSCRCAQQFPAQGPHPTRAVAHHGTGVPHSWLCAAALGGRSLFARADEPIGA
jgi:hypothetical protein